MVRYALGETVDGVESVAGVWSRHYPFVVRFVQGLVYPRVVQATVDPIDEEVCKANEERELEDVVEPERCLSRRIVQFGMALHFADKEGDGEYSHDWERDRGLLDLQADLILKIFGVGEGGMVEDEEIGEGGANEVDDEAEEPGAMSIRLLYNGREHGAQCFLTK